MKELRKKLIILSVITVLILGNMTFVFAENDSPITVIIDGQQQTYDVNPIIVSGRTLVPMRGIFEALGAELEWDSENRIANATKEDMNISVKIDSYFATINNQAIKLDVQPIIENGRTMVPLRFISEAFGADVSWIPETRTVSIATQNEDATQEEIQNVESKEADESVMTYEKAIEMALKNSNELRNKKLELEKAEELLENTYLTPGTYNPVLIQTNKGRQISKESAEKEIEITKESIKFQVENAINDINILEKELTITEFKMNNDKEKLRIEKLKAEHGLESKFNLDMLTKTQEEQKKEKEVLQLKLNDAYEKLNHLLALSKDERYKTEENIVYSPLVDVDIDSLVRKELSNNIHIWSYEKQIESAELGVKLYEYNALPNQDPYKVKEIDVVTAKNNLKKLKENLEKELRSKYNQIKQIEENYDILQINLEKAEKALDLAKARYNVGMAIELDVDEARLAVEQIKFNMEKLALQHQQLVKTLYQPSLAPTYLQ